MKRFFSLLLKVMVLAAIPCVAYAGINCSVDSTASVLSFGAYDVLSLANNDKIGIVRIGCNSSSAGDSVSPEISIGTGSAGGAWATSRRMTGAPGILNYQIYRDASRVTIWIADTLYSVPSFTLSPANVNVVRDIPVYGRIPMQQNVGVGSYADSLNVIVNW